MERQALIWCGDGGGPETYYPLPKLPKDLLVLEVLYEEPQEEPPTGASV